MKNIACFCGVLIGLLCSFCACDEVAEQARLITVPTAASSTDTLQKLSVQKAVLIKNFTGQNCVHCPRAHALIAELQATYGEDKVVAVALHGGPLSLENSETQKGLRNAWTQQYFDHWSVPWLPCALINRVSEGGRKLWSEGEWKNKVIAQLQDSSNVQLSLSSRYSATDDSIRVEVECKALRGSVKGKLQLWLLENQIFALQKKQGEAPIANYEHEHVLRESFNGLWGEAVELAPKQTLHIRHSLQKKAAYVAQHLQVVAFIYNEQGVQQVVTQKLSR